MLKSTKRAIILTRKQIIIAAIAITGLMLYPFPHNMLASADHRDINIPLDIEIPCLPNCNTANEPEDVDVDNGRPHVQLAFSFVPE